MLEEDVSGRRFKVRYIGYGEEYDKWKPVEDVVNVGDSCSDSESECDEFSQSADAKSLRYKPYSLYDELSFRTKSMLISNRKGDPVCMVSMNLTQYILMALFEGASHYQDSVTQYPNSQTLTIFSVKGGTYVG